MNTSAVDGQDTDIPPVGDAVPSPSLADELRSSAMLFALVLGVTAGVVTLAHAVLGLFS